MMDYGDNFGFDELSDREREGLQKVLSTAQTCDEVTLFLMIEGMGAVVSRLGHHETEGLIAFQPAVERELEVARRQVEIARDQAVRFGVPEPVYVLEIGVLGPQYQRWYEFWETWKRGMSNDDWRTFDDLHARARSGEGTSEAYQHLLPKVGWQGGGA
jgi:hypothetical protein